MEQTVAVITGINSGLTICSINTTKHGDSFINGYPFSYYHALMLKQNIGAKVKVQLGHIKPIPTYITTIKHVEVGPRIVKISFEEGAFQSQKGPHPETAEQTNFSLRNVWNKLL